MRKLAISLAFICLLALFGPCGGAQCTTNCVITNPTGNQTITQPSGTSLIVAGNILPKSIDYVLYADQFSGADIGAQITNAFNSIACATTSSSSGPQSIEVIVPANAYKTYGTTIAPQACTASGQSNPLRILELNGSVLYYTGSKEAFLLVPGSVWGTLNTPLIIENGQLIGTSAATAGFHIQDGGGSFLNNLTVTGFTAGCGTEFDDINYSPVEGVGKINYTEQTIVQNGEYGSNLHQICYINDPTTPGSGSFLYNTIIATHLGIADGQDGIYVSGSGTSQSANLWTGNFDIKFNVTTYSTPGNVFHVVNGGWLLRDALVIRGERTGGTVGLQNCTFLQGDALSGFNTSANIPQALATNICGYTGTTSSTHNINFQNDESYQPEGYLLQARATKWSNHGGNNQGYTQIFGAAPGTEHDGGFQITSRANPTSGNSESDTVTSTSDTPIKNVLDCESANGGSCGFGTGWYDTSGVGYNISATAGLTCSGTTGLVTLASGTLAQTYSGVPVIVSGGTTTAAPIVTITGETRGSLSGTAGASTATITFNNTCTEQNSGAFFIYQYPSAAVDTTSLRVGTATTTSQATTYTQLATFVTGSVSPGPYAAATCTDVSESVTSANGALTTANDLPFNVIAPGALGSGPVSVTSPYKPAAGHITLRFCNNSTTTAWTPPSGVYTVVSIH